MIEGTAMAWTEAVTDGKLWNEGRDLPRFRSAFVMLAKTRESWPAPKHFLESIPPAPQPLVIGRESRPVSPEVAAANAERIRAMLADVVRKMPTATADRDAEKDQLARVERELRQHYSKSSTVGTGP